MPQLLLLAAWPDFLEDAMTGILGGWGEDERLIVAYSTDSTLNMVCWDLDPTAVDTEQLRSSKRLIVLSQALIWAI